MRITMIGAGAMGGATVEGLVKGQVFKCEDITVSDPSERVLEKFQQLGTRVTTDNLTAVKDADVVCVCVKPWLVEQVLKGVREALNPERQVLVVIAAGVPSASIREWLGEQCPPLFLCIPNIAIAQLASMTFIVPCAPSVASVPSVAISSQQTGQQKASAQQQQTELVKAIFEKMGTVLITDEQHLPAGTTLASCGIAYAMRYIRAASEGGVELGFRADQAKEIVMQTMLGAVKLLEASGLHPEAAIDLVTTPGGITIKGLNEMEHAGFTSAVIRGLKSSCK